MNIRDILRMITEREISDLDTEIIILNNGKYKRVYDFVLCEKGLDCEDVYKELRTDSLILVIP